MSPLFPPFHPAIGSPFFTETFVLRVILSLSQPHYHLAFSTDRLASISNHPLVPTSIVHLFNFQMDTLLLLSPVAPHFWKEHLGKIPRATSFFSFWCLLKTLHGHNSHKIPTWRCWDHCLSCWSVHLTCPVLPNLSVCLSFIIPKPFGPGAVCTALSILGSWSTTRLSRS